MNISEIETPAILLDLDVMEDNIRRCADLARDHGKQLWPMVKTHKSLELAARQAEAGAAGFLCGTLDEAEALAKAGYRRLMYAYPVATEVSIRRALRLQSSCELILRIDGTEAARALNAAAGKDGLRVPYTIIIDAGLHRFGVPPREAGAFARELGQFENLVFRGISSHPGHVYGASSARELPRYCREEREALRLALASLREEGFSAEIVSSGSTPTFAGTVADENLGIYHPGNYIFNDAIQLSTDTATREQCALTVLASVISRPREELLICDAGAKCLGLDLGAHGNASIRGHGLVLGHPELSVDSLSEEVGKLHVHGETSLKVGDKVRIIPNHACSAANLTSFYIGVRGDRVDHVIPVDIRGNGTKKNAVG